MIFEALEGRGRKRKPWVASLYKALRTEFCRLHALDVKLSSSVLVCAAKSLIDNADSESLFGPTVLVRGKPIKEKITVRWIQTFMEANFLVIRRQAGNLAVSPEKKIYIEHTVTFHLGRLKRAF